MDPLNFYSNVSSMRAGLTTTSTFTSQTGLTGGSGISSNVIGALSLRAFDDTGLYALRTLTAGNPLPSPLASKPVLDQQLTSIDLTNATFGTISAGYSLKINGYVQPPATGTYLFRTTYRDGVSLYISTRKLLDSWTYQGTVQQSVGTLTMYQNVWYNFAIEHAAASSAERLLVEWSNPGGTFATLQQSTGAFTFAYDTREIDGSLMGTSYIYGRANFADVANLSAGIVLPNANFFSGNTSELNNDGGFFKNTSGTVSGNAINISGTVSAAALTFTGTSTGTLLQFNNVVSTVSGTVTTTAYAAMGVTPGTALDRYALSAHRWWTGSSGTSSGTVSLQLSSASLTVGGSITAMGLQFVGTTAGTLLQFNNVVSTVSGTVTTTAYGAFGISPGTALDRYALNAHRWWTGSSGTSSGMIGMQLSSGGLTLSTVTASAVVPSSTVTGVNIGNVFIGGSTQQFYGNYSTVNTAGNVSYTVSQIMGGYMVRNAQSNGSYTDTLPSAAAFFTACNGIVNATFQFVICPLYSVKIATGSGGVIYCGLAGDNGGFATSGVGQLAQGNVAILLPNSTTYVLMFIITSATSYTVFIK